MCKLIVLDDDQIQHLIIKRMLMNYDQLNDTIYSTDGHTILDFLKLHKKDKSILPEILLMDLHMPKLNGWKFLDHLEVLYPQLIKPITVYILSSSIDPKDIKRCSKYPFVKSYLVKPVTKEALNPIMENIH
ncbi:response regulator [Mucilaginibacter sp.]|jgi:CheY-like chemotaxis protein|uniref:response regulator n=1 Tax=Mucilaginibacter sp. TaxID=1882438 RepID=UPI003564B64A